MKCNNFGDILDKLDAIEKEELEAAVRAHGGSYRFKKDDRMTITFDTADELDGADDVEVCQVSINDKGALVITGIPRDQLDKVELDPDDAAPGNLHYITEAILKTRKVNDVTTPVTLLSLDGKESMRDALSAIRKMAVTKIKVIMEEAGLRRINACDICGSNSPAVRPDEFDDDNTQTLDSIRITRDGLVFGASACYDECEYYEENIPLDALVDIMGWLEDNKEELENLDEDIDKE